MMTSRDRVIRTLNHEPVDRTPRDLWPSPALERLRGDELAEMFLRYPNDVQQPEFRYPCGARTKGRPHDVGDYTDAWGCTWRIAEPGGVGQLQSPPLSEPWQLADYRPPLELLDEADLEGVNRECAATSCFVLARTETRPFERLQWLRGREAVLAGLADGNEPLGRLLERLHEFSRREMETWASTDVDGVAFRDDWGSEDGLLVAPQTWRDWFKPLYRDYCEILHRQDKFAFFHSHGNVAAILPDLVEIGVDAVHAELFLMDVQSLADGFRGRVTFWGEIDRHHVLPRGTPGDVRDAVRRVRKALDYGRGGLVAQCQWEPNVPFENVAAFFEAWLAPLPVHA
jgi:uroporphyrinogen decarboxylase